MSSLIISQHIHGVNHGVMCAVSVRLSKSNMIFPFENVLPDYDHMINILNHLFTTLWPRDYHVEYHVCLPG